MCNVEFRYACLPPEATSTPYQCHLYCLLTKQIPIRSNSLAHVRASLDSQAVTHFSIISAVLGLLILCCGELIMHSGMRTAVDCLLVYVVADGSVSTY